MHTETEKASLYWRKADTPDARVVENLIKNTPGLHPMVAQLLASRGYTTMEAVRSFLTPGMPRLEEPIDMKDLEVACARVAQAVDSNEPILVYGDYDVDGTCSTAMMYRFLQTLGARCAFYNPDRYQEGYGISTRGIDFAESEGFGLVIALDCGIMAAAQITDARQRGIDFIVCDHHLPGAELPPAVAVLNPKQKDCPLNGEELCGCGVGFVLLKRLCTHYGLDDAAWKSALPLVAVATCCDIVDLTGLNRSLVKAGLDMLNENPDPGIAAMLKKAAYEGVVSVSDVVFKIGPRINAAGRLAHAREAVELLTSGDLPAAMPYAERLETLNRERRQLDKDITAQAIEVMRTEDPDDSMATTVVRHPEWHKGVIGIVASRLTEVVYRPAIVFTEADGMLTGSARSVADFDLHAAIASCSDLLDRFGGHHAAAGLSLKSEHFAAFRRRFEDFVSQATHQEQATPSLRIDAETDFTEWYDERFHQFFNQLNRLQPYGPKNMEPVFCTRGCEAADVRVVGTDHLKFKVYQPAHPGLLFPVISFGTARYYEALRTGAPFDLAYTVGSNHWNGRTSFQLEAKDITLA